MRLVTVTLPACSLPEWEQARLSRTASAGMLLHSQLAEARQRLLAHLDTSRLWLPSPVLQRLQGTDLWQEQVAVHHRVRHSSAAT